MTRDIKEIITRLLNISKDITDEFGVLGALSYEDKEKTAIFDNHINKLKKVLDTESIIINNLSVTELCEIFRLLPSYNDGSLIYERTFTRIENHLESMYNDVSIAEDAFDEIEATVEYELGSDQLDSVASHFEADPENAKYDDMFTNYINIYALKRIHDRIQNTTTENKSDANLKEAMLKQLKILKYLILSQNIELEKLGVKYRFDIRKMPYLEMPDADVSTIAYNHCISIIAKMYRPYIGRDQADTNTLNLFNMICFEAYLNHIDRNKIYKLASICDEFRMTTSNPFYGDIAKTKVLNKN